MQNPEIAQQPDLQAVAPHALLSERAHLDDGSVRAGVAAVLAGVVLTGAAAYGLVEGVRDAVKDGLKNFTSADPKGTDVKLSHKVIKEVGVGCSTIVSYDVTGTGTVANMHEVTQKAMFTQGRGFHQTCLEAGAMHFSTGTNERTGEPVNYIDLKLSKFIFSTTIVDAKVESDMGDKSNVIKGGVLVASGAANSLCDFVTQNHCETGKKYGITPNMIKAVLEKDATDLRWALQVETIRAIGLKCAPLEWRAQYMGEKKLYEDQAKKLDIKATVRFVDDDGNPVDPETFKPDYTNNVLKSFVKQGVIRDPNAPTFLNKKIEKNVTCDTGPRKVLPVS